MYHISYCTWYTYHSCLLFSDQLKTRNLVIQMEKKLRMAQLCLMQSPMMMTKQRYMSMSLIDYAIIGYTYYLLLFRFTMGNDTCPLTTSLSPDGAVPLSSYLPLVSLHRTTLIPICWPYSLFTGQCRPHRSLHTGQCCRPLSLFSQDSAVILICTISHPPFHYCKLCTVYYLLQFPQLYPAQYLNIWIFVY